MRLPFLPLGLFLGKERSFKKESRESARTDVSKIRYNQKSIRYLPQGTQQLESSPFLLLALVGRVAYSNVVNSFLLLQYQRILCHRIGCALPLPLYQKIALCGRLTLNFSQWEESPYLRFFVWHSKLSFLRETESVTTEALSTCPVFG